MRTFDHVDNKLFESDFFLRKLQEIEFALFELRCYFSAFVSSSRSVTFALQASMKGQSGFESWYTDIQDELRENELAKFFNDCRVDDQKLGFNQIVRGHYGSGQMLWFFGEPEPNRYRFIPEIDVVSACEAQMVTICEVVDRAYRDFGFLIDPDQRFRPEAMLEHGISLEELEEELGFPRGWTDLDIDVEKKDLHRLSLLVRQCPRSAVKPLLAQYLKRDLSYPSEPFRYP